MTTTGRPAIRAGTLPRDALVSRLAAVGDDVPLLNVVAPAGYGKTTALSQWANESRRPFVWVQLDPTHNDPICLVHQVAQALPYIQPGNEGLQHAPIGRRPPATARAVQWMIDSLRAVPEPMVLVLDDLHHVRQRAGLDVVMMLAENAPPGSHVVVASRRQPRLRLARMRGEGRCVDFGPVDLAFTEAEAKAFLDQVGVDLSDEMVQILMWRTEGWPAGICLAASSMRGKKDVATVVEAIGGDNRHIVDYLRDEVLSLQSAETARFLMRTAVLERMSAPLCDAALGTTGSAAWLSEIRTLNLFIIPLDEHDEWFRYHRMFAEMLRSELRRREPGETERIHERAVTWFTSRNLSEPALRHATSSGDTSTAIRVIAEHVQRMNSRGRLMHVRAWLEEIDDAGLARYPPGAVAAAWVWALAGDAARARRSLRIAESSTSDDLMPDGSSSFESAVLRTRAALAPDGLKTMRADAERAVELEPPGSPWHTQASLLCGVALLLTGSAEEAAAALFQSAVRFGGSDQRPGSVFSLAQLSLIAADRGEWTSAATLVAEADRLIEAGDLQGSLASLLAYAAGARLALHRGDPLTARTHVREALRLYETPSPQAFPWLAVQTAIVLGQILLDLDDVPAARRKAQEANRLLGSLGDSVSLEAQYQELVTALERASARASAVDATGLTPAETRILQVLPTHLSLSEIAQELVISRNTVKTQVTAIYRKLGAVNRTAAVRKAQERGLLER